MDNAAAIFSNPSSALLVLVMVLVAALLVMFAPNRKWTWKGVFEKTMDYVSALTICVLYCVKVTEVVLALSHTSF